MTDLSTAVLKVKTASSQMVRCPDHDDGAAEQASCTDAGAAGHARESGHDRVRADTDVVRNLHLVVHLDAVFDHGVLDSAAIHGGIGPDFHVVADHHATQLRHLYPLRIFTGKPEAVAADHRPGMEKTAPAHPDAVH